MQRQRGPLQHKLAAEVVVALTPEQCAEALGMLLHLRMCIDFISMCHLDERAAGSYKVANDVTRMVLAELAIQGNEVATLQCVIRDEICDRAEFLRLCGRENPRDA